MQSINTAAPAPLFMATLFGTALATVALGVSSLPRLDQPVAGLQLGGSVLYLGVVLVTVVHHVPSNDALASVAPRAADADRYRVRYVADWTAWNHVRTGLSVAATATLAASFGV